MNKSEDHRVPAAKKAVSGDRSDLKTLRDAAVAQNSAIVEYFEALIQTRPDADVAYVISELKK